MPSIKQIVILVSVVSVICVILFFFTGVFDESLSQGTAENQTKNSTPTPIAFESQQGGTAPKIDSSATQKDNLSTYKALASEPLVYDDALTFLQNIESLRNFCVYIGPESAGQYLTRDYLDQLYYYADGQLGVLLDILETSDGPGLFKSILLACIAVNQDPAAEEAIWETAVDIGEESELRQTAAYLLSESWLIDPQPDRLRTLLESDNTQIVLAAMRIPERHWDSGATELAVEVFRSSEDVHLRTAAVPKISWFGGPEVASQLVEALVEEGSSKDEPFTDSSVVKRVIIENLPSETPNASELFETIAFDSDEDPGVRSKAILRLADFPKELDSLRSLLNQFGSSDYLLLRATIDALMLSGDENDVNRIAQKVLGLSDDHVKSILLNRHPELKDIENE
jgi:hypothetical protein